MQRIQVEGLLRVPAPLRLTITNNQGKEMAHHKELAAATGIQVYFADPHAPWQRGSRQNTNGLLRQYLPKGADLSEFDQTHLDGGCTHAPSTHDRASAMLTLLPDEVFDALLDKVANADHAEKGSGVSFQT